MLSKLRIRKKEEEFKKLMVDAMEKLRTKDQKEFIVDCLESYFVEHIKKSQGTSAVDDYFVDRCKFTMEHGDTFKAREVMQRVVAHTENTKPEIASALAASYESQKVYTEAYRYYFKSCNQVKIVECLEQIMLEGYPSEYDLFYARAAVDMLSRQSEVARTEYIIQKGKDKCGATPILDLIEFYTMFLRAGNSQMLKKMCVEDYAQVLKRDPELEGKLDKICEKAFGEGFKPANPMQAMLANMMGGKK